jgi:aryl-alcohol dehydrogenase-like predicted oxidoreductase
MPVWQFAKMLFTAEAHSWTRFVTMQNHYNLLYREEEREMIPFCLDQGIGVLPWSPLARGLLAGKERSKTVRAATDTYGHQLYGEQLSEADERVVESLETVAGEMGIRPAQLALGWLLQKPSVVAPIIGVSKRGQLDDALAAVEVQISSDLIVQLEKTYVPHSVAGI